MGTQGRMASTGGLEVEPSPRLAHCLPSGEQPVWPPRLFISPADSYAVALTFLLCAIT